MKVICDCGEILKYFDECINGSLNFECDECGKCYNVYECEKDY